MTIDLVKLRAQSTTSSYLDDGGGSVTLWRSSARFFGISGAAASALTRIDAEVAALEKLADTLASLHERISSVSVGL